MKTSRMRRGCAVRTRAAGAQSESGIDVAATTPTSTPAVVAVKLASRHMVANQPKTTYACSDWNPKKRIMDTPIGVRSTSTKPTVCGLRSMAWSWATIGSHGMAAMTATSAQTPRPVRQPPPACEIGTVRVRARVRPIARRVV
jgi:hypothetical protein